MLKALEVSLGVVTSACKKADVARSTHYQWMQEDEEYKKEVESVQDMALDFAETQLFSNIQEGNTIAIIFYLKTKGKKRGFIEKTETGFTDNDGNDVIPVQFYLPDNGRSKNNPATKGVSGEGA